MKVELVQGIKLKDTNNGVRSIHKFIETEIKPSVGDYITNDSLWKDPYEYEVKYVGVRLKIDPLFIEDKNLQFETPWRYTLKSFLAFILAMCLALSVSAVSETGNETTGESTLTSRTPPPWSRG